MVLGPRGQTVVAIVKGVLAAMAFTLVCMALLALLVVQFGLPDGMLTALNQLAKVAAIFLGCWVTVRPGGLRGFALGAATGLTYMLIGYALYCLLDGALLSPWLLTGEFLMGVGLGALSGALIANLKPSKKRRRTKSKRITPAA